MLLGSLLAVYAGDADTVLRASHILCSCVSGHPFSAWPVCTARGCRCMLCMLFLCPPRAGPLYRAESPLSQSAFASRAREHCTLAIFAPRGLLVRAQGRCWRVALHTDTVPGCRPPSLRYHLSCAPTGLVIYVTPPSSLTAAGCPLGVLLPPHCRAPHLPRPRCCFAATAVRAAP